MSNIKVSDEYMNHIVVFYIIVFYMSAIVIMVCSPCIYNTIIIIKNRCNSYHINNEYIVDPLIDV